MQPRSTPARVLWRKAGKHSLPRWKMRRKARRPAPTACSPSVSSCLGTWPSSSCVKEPRRARRGVRSRAPRGRARTRAACVRDSFERSATASVKAAVSLACSSALEELLRGAAAGGSVGTAILVMRSALPLLLLLCCLASRAGGQQNTTCSAQLSGWSQPAFTVTGALFGRRAHPLLLTAPAHGSRLTAPSLQACTFHWPATTRPATLQAPAPSPARARAAPAALHVTWDASVAPPGRWSHSATRASDATSPQSARPA